MFTGLVQDLGEVAALDELDDGRRLRITTPLAAELGLGDSIAVNGVCLTATEVSADGFAAEAVAETLRRSSLGDLTPGSKVNLELALRATDRLGGHVVQGHVDGLTTVAAIRQEGISTVMTFALPDELARYVVEKGSIALDGVSLTVATLDDADGSFDVALIPETVARTRLGSVAPGDRINVEVDVLAKYVERMTQVAR